jgi:hypothetical protein
LPHDHQSSIIESRPRKVFGLLMLSAKRSFAMHLRWVHIVAFPLRKRPGPSPRGQSEKLAVCGAGIDCAVDNGANTMSAEIIIAEWPKNGRKSRIPHGQKT